MKKQKEPTGKFKAGDKVVVVSSPGSAEIGATATVLGYTRDKNDNDVYTNVVWDRNKKAHGQNDGGYYDYYFKLCKPKKEKVHKSIFGTYTDQDVADAFGKGFTAEDKRKFATGAIRDVEDNKEDYVESISWLAFRRFAQYMSEKAKKYGRGNWIKGIPIESYETSLMRHLQKYLSAKYYGIDTEPNYDHLAAAMFNLQGIMHEEEKLKNGKK